MGNSESMGEPFVRTGFTVGVSVILRSLSKEECLVVVIPFFTCPYGSILLSDEVSTLNRNYDCPSTCTSVV